MDTICKQRIKENGSIRKYPKGYLQIAKFVVKSMKRSANENGNKNQH